VFCILWRNIEPVGVFEIKLHARWWNILVLMQWGAFNGVRSPCIWIVNFIVDSVMRDLHKEEPHSIQAYSSRGTKTTRDTCDIQVHGLDEKSVRRFGGKAEVKSQPSRLGLDGWIILKMDTVWCRHVDRIMTYVVWWGHAVAQLIEALRYKPEGLIPDGFIGIYHWHNPSGRTMALGTTQPLTEMSTRNISWR
jgi:hypothetical protein